MKVLFWLFHWKWVFDYIIQNVNPTIIPINWLHVVVLMSIQLLFHMIKTAFSFLYLWLFWKIDSSIAACILNMIIMLLVEQWALMNVFFCQLVMTDSTMSRCVWTCFSAYAIKFIITWILELLPGQLMQGWSQMPFTFYKPAWFSFAFLC